MRSISSEFRAIIKVSSAIAELERRKLGMSDMDLSTAKAAAREARWRGGVGSIIAVGCRTRDHWERWSFARFVPIVLKVVMIELASVSAKYLVASVAQFCKTVELPDITNTV